MSYYKVSLKPAEPYFLGNEKNFIYPGQTNGGEYANSYFIRSEDTPSQTTILGALRYLLLPCVKKDFRYSDEEKKKNEEAVGNSSFQAESKDKQSFGWITQLSPVFLEDALGNEFIPCPMDHKKGESTYSPFGKYSEIKTSEGDKLFTTEYVAKKGLESGYLCLGTKEIISSSGIFQSSLRIGINRSNKTDGFFKKEYKMLDKKYSFTIFAKIALPEDKSITGKYIVTLGQGKSPFSVDIKETKKSVMDNFNDRIIAALGSDNRLGYSMIYCFGDAFPEGNPCDGTVFAAYSTRDHRSFIRSAGSSWKVEKGSILYRMIKAGSIFLTNDPEGWKAKHSHSNGEQIGFNQFITVGGKQNEN